MLQRSDVPGGEVGRTVGGAWQEKGSRGTLCSGKISNEPDSSPGNVVDKVACHRYQ